MKTIIQAIRFLILMTILTGVVYPLAVTAIAKNFLSAKSEGSLVKDQNGNVAGSTLIAQKFTFPEYFQGRPSGSDYATIASGGSNNGPTSMRLKKMVEERIAYWTPSAKPDLQDQNPPVIPAELIFASGSGLDPHLSPEAVLFQVDRVARARNFNETQKSGLVKLIGSLTEYPQFGILGQRRINVLHLNMELDKAGL